MGITPNGIEKKWVELVGVKFQFGGRTELQVV
jgi:hypothetical protein